MGEVTVEKTVSGVSRPAGGIAPPDGESFPGPQGMTSQRKFAGTVASQTGVLILGVMMIVTIWATVLHNLWDTKNQATEAAIQNSANLARAFEEHIVRSIRSIDQAIVYARAAYEADPAGFDLAAWSKNSLFLADVAAQIALIGPDGFMLATSVAASAR